MAEERKANEGGSQTDKATLQRYLQTFTKEAIDGMVVIMRTSRNEQLKFAAQKLFIDKAIADAKAPTEVTGLNGEPIKLNIIAGANYFSPSGESSSASTGGAVYQPAPIQGSGVAQASEEDNNGNQPISEGKSA